MHSSAVTNDQAVPYWYVEGNLGRGVGNLGLRRFPAAIGCYSTVSKRGGTWGTLEPTWQRNVGIVVSVVEITDAVEGCIYSFKIASEVPRGSPVAASL